MSNLILQYEGTAIPKELETKPFVPDYMFQPCLPVEIQLCTRWTRVHLHVCPPVFPMMHSSLLTRKLLSKLLISLFAHFVCLLVYSFADLFSLFVS